MARQTPIQTAINRNANRVGLTTSVRGRMSAGRRSAAGNIVAGGMGRSMSTNTGAGDMGRGNLMVSRRKRYYDVRLGLGMAGG